MSAFPTPTVEGFYWAKWRIAGEGTDHCRNCGHRHSEWEEPNGLEIEDWAVVEVVENCLDESDPEYLMVQVPGVSHWQSIENFYWGPQVTKPEPIRPSFEPIREMLRKGRPS